MLLTMAVYDTVENSRTWMTEQTLKSLRKTVDWQRHRLMISDNGSCRATQDLYDAYAPLIDSLFLNRRNLGTANALNKAWRERRPGEVVCKIDNDVVWHLSGWADQIALVFQKDPTIGICGLKRRDLDEWPLQTSTNGRNFYQSTLRPLPHEKGEPWLIVEDVNHVIGTCQAFAPALLDQIGYLWQPGLYGFDDALACARAKVAGFACVFLHGQPIDHIDPGGTDFITWKQQHAGQFLSEYFKILAEYQRGVRPIYYDGGFSEQKKGTLL